MTRILVLHGPDLNLLGSREPHIYGHDTLVTVNKHLKQQAKSFGLTLLSIQSNAEHELVNAVQAAKQDSTDFIIINPAAFGHTSIALRDALLAIAIPFIEVHISNVYNRESFRRHSYLADIAVGTINGLGIQGYLLALQYAHYYLTSTTQ